MHPYTTEHTVAHYMLFGNHPRAPADGKPVVSNLTRTLMQQKACMGALQPPPAPEVLGGASGGALSGASGGAMGGAPTAPHFAVHEPHLFPALDPHPHPALLPARNFMYIPQHHHAPTAVLALYLAATTNVSMDPAHRSAATLLPSYVPRAPYVEPDHYVTYHEYLAALQREQYDEHLNIVEYPVAGLLEMLACLLTKIIEANDRLHPNHFDSTLALRQRLRRRRTEPVVSQSHGISTTVAQVETHSDLLDDEAESKNRYLANVLSFHGTNVPPISLQAYLVRVLKYCPLTNEVFLSLLVYFDRIAKKANHLRDGGEQLFVMDLYNIHRLIILGITVSSKFFSDIFYKNLRYAKVGGVLLEELNYLEIQFMLLLDFKFMISVEEMQNYGDLLLKFWKREQLAAELKDSAPGAP